MVGRCLSLFKLLEQNTTDLVAYKQHYFLQFWKLEVQDQGTSMVRGGPSSSLQTSYHTFTRQKGARKLLRSLLKGH